MGVSVVMKEAKTREKERERLKFVADNEIPRCSPRYVFKVALNGFALLENEGVHCLCSVRATKNLYLSNFVVFLGVLF